MAEKGKTWFAILGFLSWKPMSGYDIKNLVDISLAYFWTISYGQIYPTLKKLVDAGFATTEIGAGTGARQRNLFSITPAGQLAFDEWMKQRVDLSVQRDEMQLKLFLGGQRDTGQTISLIEDFRRQQSHRRTQLLREYDETSPALESGEFADDIKWLEPEGLSGMHQKQAVREQTLIFLLSIRQGILKAEARITWCDEAISLLENPPYAT